MKHYNLLLIVFISNLLPCMLYAGTAYYVDCSDSGSSNLGTYAEPFNLMSTVNAHAYATGDDLYFKVNTTCILTADSDRLQINWGGTSGDRAIIGAYYDDGQFGLNGNSRPILDGNSNYPSQYFAVIDENNSSASNITIQDIRIEDSGAYGVRIGNADNVNVENCYFYHPKHNCIVYGSANGGVDTGTVSHNTCDDPQYDGGGAAIEITSSNVEGRTTNITIEYNTVFSGMLEGIGLYKKPTYCTVQYNIVYDIRNVGIYIDGAQHIAVRYNLVYQSTSYPLEYGPGFMAIAIDQEKWQTYRFTGYNEVYGNLLAGTTFGISLGCEITQCTGLGIPYSTCKGDFSGENCYDSTRIYNNTLVDNTYNIRLWNPSPSDSIEIKNNISWTISEGTNHAHNYSPAGVTWSHNLFDEAVSGNAANNAVIGNPALSKTSGWRTIVLGSISPNDFKLANTGSAAYNAGTDLGGSPYNIDYWGTDRDANQPWDIGAHEYVDVDTTPPAKPTGLIIVE